MVDAVGFEEAPQTMKGKSIIPANLHPKAGSIFLEPLIDQLTIEMVVTIRVLPARPGRK